MGRSTHCSESQRENIKRLRQGGLTLKKIADLIGCSINMVSNALKNKTGPETRGGKRKTSTKTDARIIRFVKKNPFTTSSEIKKELNLEIDSSTIRRRLLEHNLKGSLPKKCPMLSKKNIRSRMEFARDHVHWPITKWRNILWSDESKINLFGSDCGQQYVRRPKGKQYDPRYTIKTVKHGGGNIMIWGCFSYSGVGPIVWIKDIMNKEFYLNNILCNTMLPFAEDNMPLRWVFQQDNDSKHTAKVVKNWFQDNNITIMKWPAQSPDLNPIENLWADVKRGLGKLPKPQNRLELWENVEKVWMAIPPEKCQKLVDSMGRRCNAVIANKGFTTKY